MTHFQTSEFKCPHCGVALVRPKLLSLLERVRAVRGAPLRIVSGYRCPVHNAAVGGAKDSQHMYASAADIPAGHLTIAEAHRLGIPGFGSKGPWVVHVDVRDVPVKPWVY